MTVSMALIRWALESDIGHSGNRTSDEPIKFTLCKACLMGTGLGSIKRSVNNE